MAVHKIIVQATVLVEAESLAEAVSKVDALSLEQLHYEMDTGEFIGAVQIVASETVEPEFVRDELIALGNDGEFFSDLAADRADDESTVPFGYSFGD